MGLELHGFWVLSGQDETTMERDSMRNIWTERERIKAARVAVYQSLCDWLLSFSVGSSLFFSFFFLYFTLFLFYFYFLFFWVLEERNFSTGYLSLQLTYSFILKHTNTRI